MFDVIPKNGQTWIICGGRGFTDAVMFDAAMSDLMRLKGCPDRIVHGDYRGADKLADKWGKRMALDVIPEPADWGSYGHAAGPIRNKKMLTYKPDLVVAFPGGTGTANMIMQAKAADPAVDVAEVKAGALQRKMAEGSEGE